MPGRDINRPTGFGYVEFSTRNDLIGALRLHEEVSDPERAINDVSFCGRKACPQSVTQFPKEANYPFYADDGKPAHKS